MHKQREFQSHLNKHKDLDLGNSQNQYMHDSPGPKVSKSMIGNLKNSTLKASRGPGQVLNTQQNTTNIKNSFH